MGKIKNSKKMKITSIFKAKEITQQHVHPWQWRPSCIQQPKSRSFRAGHGNDDIFKTVNSVFLDGDAGVKSPDSSFTNTSMSASFSTESGETYLPVDSVEALVREMVRSEDRRLFFEPGENETSSILQRDARLAPAIDEGKGVFPFKGGVALAVESEDPYHDFRRSMEEMVESHGLKDWECLEELLSWYLRVNGGDNHGLIIDAFIDLLVSLSPNCVSVVTNENATPNTTCYSSAASSFSNLEIKEEGLS